MMINAKNVQAEIERAGEQGTSLAYVIEAAKSIVYALADESKVKAAYDRGYARRKALDAAQKAMQTACPHPVELQQERPGGHDRSGVSWCTDVSCGACGKELGSR